MSEWKYSRSFPSVKEILKNLLPGASGCGGGDGGGSMLEYSRIPTPLEVIYPSACLSPGSMNDDRSGSDATSSSTVGSGGGRDPDRLLTSIEGRGWGGGGFKKDGEEGCRIVCFSSDIVEA